MIDETKQQAAIDYILGELSPADAAAFEKTLNEDEELRQFTRELTDGVASIALAAPSIRPRPELFSRIQSGIGLSNRSKIIRLSFLPWALAACLAIACLILGLNNLKTRGLVTELQQRERLVHLQIATLQAQADAYARTSGIVVWDPQKQEGLLRLSSVSPPEPGHDYQLWIIDPSKKTPVSAGVVTVGAAGVADVEFRPVQQVSAAAGFAVSIEKAGGSTVPEGRIILAGR
jgi:anti-sigma-K factor RskA